MLSYLAQQHFTVAPRDVEVFTMETHDAVAEDRAVSVAAVSTMDSDNQQFTFLEWDETASFSVVQALPLAADVQSFCAVVPSVSSAGLAPSNFRATIVASLANGTVVLIARTVDEDGEVLYQLLPSQLRNEDTWSCCTTTERRAAGGVVVAAQTDRPFLRVVEVKSGRMQAVGAPVALPYGTAGFACRQMAAVVGDPNSIYVLVQSTVYLMTLVSASNGGSMTAVAKQTWRWSPHDRLLCFAVKDNCLFGGSEDGAIAVWNIASTSTSDPIEVIPTKHSQAPEGAVQSIVAHSAMHFSTASSDGTVRTYRRQPRAVTASPFSSTRVFPPPTAPTHSWFGAPSMMGLSANHYHAVALDDSGMLYVWGVQ